jgi:hypothetical protein
LTLSCREDHLWEIIRRLACSTSSAIFVVATSSARAASPVPQPPVDLGQTSFLDGEAGRGGLLEIIGNGYVASQFANASGGPVAGTNRQWSGTVIFHVAYVSDVPVAGGFLGAETLLPVSVLHLQVAGMPQATGPAGRRLLSAQPTARPATNSHRICQCRPR